jgi:metal-responsive CopG/Arc/MetJ family transcriptional regulator
MAKKAKAGSPKPADTKQLNMNIAANLLAKVDKYRFQHMFPTRSGAIEALLEWAVEQNPALKHKEE